MEERVARQITIRVGMRVWDDHVELELTLPAVPTRLESLLPVFQRVSDGLVGLAAQRAVTGGRTVSCAKGCGACCRQIVPISGVEARGIGRAPVPVGPLGAARPRAGVGVGSSGHVGTSTRRGTDQEGPGGRAGAQHQRTPPRGGGPLPWTIIPRIQRTWSPWLLRSANRKVGKEKAAGS